MRTLFRAAMMILQLPLWIPAFPALASGAMDDYDGDVLWLPAVGAALTLILICFVVSWPFVAAWGTIKGG